MMFPFLMENGNSHEWRFLKQHSASSIRHVVPGGKRGQALDFGGERGHIFNYIIIRLGGLRPEGVGSDLELSFSGH